MDRSPLTLVITGSIAAIKSAETARLLAAHGMKVNAVLTDAAHRWTDMEALARHASIISPDEIENQPVLIAPASADFLAQLAHGGTPLAEKIRKNTAPIFIAPAMNFMMWQHPATQRNVRLLKECGMHFLGPVSGTMACGDVGYGRFMEPAPLADAVASNLRDTSHEDALPARPLLPRIDQEIAQKKSLHILLLGDDAATVESLLARGHRVTCVTDDMQHFQDDPDGMEHIRLPERADLVLVADGLSVRDMIEGRAQTMAGCMYLASKKPVAMIGSDAQLAHDGVYMLENIDALDTLLHACAAAAGKRVLILGGNVREMIDGVRCYANHALPEMHGARAADALTALGAKVTLVEAKGNTQELLAACEKYKTETWDSVLPLATIPSIVPARIFPHKLKIKQAAGTDVTLDVVGNIAATRWPNGMAPLEEIVRHVPLDVLPSPLLIPAATGPLAGRHAIITSGPTAEALNARGDVITNLSTGRQGYAIAEALAALGARVTLVSGPDMTAQEMHDACMRALPADIFVGVAAVADFAAKAPLPVLKEGEPHTLHLIQNPDILQAMGTHKTQRPKIVVGFAAETERLLEYARGKLETKNADLICANDMAKVTADRNQITCVTRGGDEPWPPMSKDEIGKRLAIRIAELLA